MLFHHLAPLLVLSLGSALAAQAKTPPLQPNQKSVPLGVIQAKVFLGGEFT
ncbi:MAG: hypothetical protein HY721_13045 [Planctomycetes bacterium]|nr:hypothetical protein [Planctomycetota bacterium]